MLKIVPLILLTRGEDLTVKAKSDAKFLVISGKPINEEIARGGTLCNEY
jgi:redox-sensitive bicupin YhaK (pirin superfamily)